MSLYNLASGELKKENNKLKQEIQRLKGALQTHEVLLQSNTKEIERLNNIINELEKYIDEKNKIKVETDGYIWQLIRPSITCKDLKNKLQELKGSKNDEQK